MPLTTPVEYLRRRSAKKRSAKPTCLAKIANLPYINPQLDSPLYSRLPAEIRTMVFEYALLAYGDPAKPYSKHSYHYRVPGYTHARRIATALLLSCRRVYMETSTLPLELNQHVVYGGETSHAPPSYRPYLFPKPSLRLVQRQAIRSVHLFAQQYWLEDWNERHQWHDFCRSWSNGLAPGLERLRVTLRHTDWWYFLLGARSPLALDPRKAGRARMRERITTGGEGQVSGAGAGSGFEEGSWGSRFSYFHGLKVFELELETLQSKRAELDEVVALAPAWRFPLGDGRVLVMDDGRIERCHWIGSSRFKGLKAPDVEPALQLQQARRAPTLTTSLRGGRQPSSTPQHSDSEDIIGLDILNYYVVLLTWTAQASAERDSQVSSVEEEKEDEEEAGNAGSRQDSRSSDSAPIPHGLSTHTGGPDGPVFADLTAEPARVAARNVIPSYWG
ncbi:MAG: hypothetical protein Q9163_004060 [Psora crenata]